MGPNLTENSQLLTVKQLAASLNISTHWIYKRTARGSPEPLPYIGVGRGKRFDLATVRNHLESRQTLTTGVMLPGTDGIARINGKAYRRMTRKRFQTGHVRLRKNHSHSWWEGLYRIDLYDEQRHIVRKRKSVTLGLLTDLPSKRSAQCRLAQILSELNDTNYKPKSDITFRSFVNNKFRDLKLGMKKGTTQHGYEVVLRKHLLPRFGDLKFTEIDAEMIQAFIKTSKRADGKPYAYNTLHNLKYVLSSVFSAAVKWGYAKENPARDADLPPEEVKEKVILPTATNLDLLITHLEEPYSTAVWLLAVSTVRPSEGFAFKVSDLDSDNCQLTLFRAVNRGKIHTPKYHRTNRPIQLTRSDVNRLQNYITTMNLSEDDWLFPSTDPSVPLRYEDVLARKIQPKAKELGLPHVTWRNLRKWGATQLVAKRVSVKAAQERLGHSRPEITLKHYAQLLEESAHEAAAVLSDQFGSKAPSRKPILTIQ